MPCKITLNTLCLLIPTSLTSYDRVKLKIKADILLILVHLNNWKEDENIRMAMMLLFYILRNYIKSVYIMKIYYHTHTHSGLNAVNVIVTSQAGESATRLLLL
jgi:hypothetical protein